MGKVVIPHAGLKAYVTNYTATALSVCREACGGHGYAAVNRFGMWRSDHDIFQTFEGDNTVLLQQVCLVPSPFRLLNPAPVGPGTGICDAMKESVRLPEAVLRLM